MTDAIDGDRDAVLARLAVSHETAGLLDIYVGLLRRWQAIKNLVAPSTLSSVWTRHVLDSGQLLPLLGPARTIADLGSGAGFPGLVLALLSRGEGRHVHLVESNGRKAAFLQEAVSATGAPASVHAVRIEAFMQRPEATTVDLVTARALAPLTDLLALSRPVLITGARALFLKGQDVGQELTEASKSWRLSVDLIPSVTDSSARIVRVAAAERLPVSA